MSRQTMAQLTMGACCALVALGCNLVLGIDEAHVDPRLEVEESTTPASTSIDEGSKPDALPAVDDSDAGSSSTEDDERDDEDDDVGGDRDDGEMEDDEGPITTDDSPTKPVPSSKPNEAAGGAAGNMHGHASSGGGGSTGIDDNTGSEQDDAGAAQTSEPSLCEKYCSEVMDLCTDGASQYRDMYQCMRVCEYLPEGELSSDVNENSVACRLRYASKARYAAGTEYEAYCRQAGPGGDGRCGSNCEGYCSLMTGVCSAEVSSVYHFDDEQQCMNTCQGLPTSNVNYSATSVEVADGNHVQCRLFHVTSAAMLDAEEHCEHAMGFTLCEADASE